MPDTHSPETPADDTSAAPSHRPQYKYDVAVSFAGEQRSFVEEVVRKLDLPPGRAFYDADYKADPWGEELSEVFTKLYRDEARFVVMFISREYAEKQWCNLERRAALRRRMMTKGAFILPVRLDSTTLDEVEGLLGTIGDLDGRREGVDGVVKALQSKLAKAMAGEPAPKEDDEPRFGEVQTTQEGLLTLLQERPNSWRWAAFASVLVQRRAAMEAAIRDHRLRYAPSTGQRIDDLGGLQELTMNTMYDVEQTGHQIDGFVRTGAFKSVFGTEDDESAADADGIVHVANRLMDFYERYIQLANRARGAAAPAQYINVLDTCARLVDGRLAGLDEFIEDYVGLVTDMPQMLIAAEGQTIVRPVALRIHVDDSVLEELLRQIKELIAASE
ncbi:hypothetical protein MAUB1S_04891 [Mycolicibacterium aubagnense]